MLVPSPSRQRQPYAVERYPAVGGVRIVGFDHNGDPAVDMTIAQRRYRPAMMTKLREWLMREEGEAAPVEGDTTPALRLAK